MPTDLLPMGMTRTFFQRVLRDGHPRVVPVCATCRERLVIGTARSDRRTSAAHLVFARCGCDRRPA